MSWLRRSRTTQSGRSTLDVRKLHRHPKIVAISKSTGLSPEETSSHLMEIMLDLASPKATNADPSLPGRQRVAASMLGLSPAKMKKLQAYAEIREEKTEDTLRYFATETAMRLLPAKPHWSHFLQGDDVVDSEVIPGDRARVRLRSGRVFTDYLSTPKMQKVYFALRDKLPNHLSAETYQAATNARWRYLNGAVPKELMPEEGGVMMECGAYVGYKAVAYGDVVGPKGRVVAVEIDAANHELLMENILQNGMSGYVSGVNCAIWHTTGTMNSRFASRSRHTIAETDNHEYCTFKKEVPTKTLDDLIDDHGLDRVDFLNLQLNGAEPEALEGLTRNFDRVRIIHTAACFSQDGVPMRTRLKDILLGRGCVVLHEGKGHRGALTVATPTASASIRDAQRES